MKVGDRDIDRFISPKMMSGVETKKTVGSKVEKILSNFSKQIEAKVTRLLHKIESGFFKGEWINNASVRKTLVARVNELKLEISHSIKSTASILQELENMKKACEALKEAGIKTKKLEKLETGLSGAIRQSEMMDKKIEKQKELVRDSNQTPTVEEPDDEAIVNPKGWHIVIHKDSPIPLDVTSQKKVSLTGRKIIEKSSAVKQKKASNISQEKNKVQVDRENIKKQRRDRALFSRTAEQKLTFLNYNLEKLVSLIEQSDIDISEKDQLDQFRKTGDLNKHALQILDMGKSFGVSNEIYKRALQAYTATLKR